MNRGARLLLLGAALALLCASSILAQDSVSLVGFSATRSGDCAVVELHTTQPADFHVERFTMGNYISVWAANLQAGGSVKEIPLDFERPDLADLATGVSLISGKHRSSIRVYLGPNADRARVTLISDGETATVRIPSWILPLRRRSRWRSILQPSLRLPLSRCSTADASSMPARPILGPRTSRMHR